MNRHHHRHRRDHDRHARSESGDCGSAGRSNRRRGAVLLEFALIAPILLTLVIGLLEFGLAHRDNLTVESAARAGARVGSNVGRDHLADYYILAAVDSTLSQLPAATTVTRVTVFETDDADGTLPPQCTTATAYANGGFFGKCNIYTAAQVSSLTPASFNTTCSGTPDRLWCPATRRVDQTTGTSWLGIRIEAEHRMVTKVFPQTMDLEQTAIMRLEPEAP